MFALPANIDGPCNIETEKSEQTVFAQIGPCNIETEKSEQTVFAQISLSQY